MIPRERFIFRGCLLLLSLVISATILFAALIWGEPVDVLNRLGIILEMVGVLAALPDLIGEEKLERTMYDARKFRNIQKSVKYYLRSTEESPSQNTSMLHFILYLAGNVIMSLMLIWLLASLVFSEFQRGWIYYGLLFSFAYLGFNALVWIILMILFVTFPKLANNAPKIFNYFVITDSLISALGVLISSALAYILNILMQILIPASRIPLKRLITTITIPFILIGSLLQLIATFY